MYGVPCWKCGTIASAVAAERDGRRRCRTARRRGAGRGCSSKAVPADAVQADLPAGERCLRLGEPKVVLEPFPARRLVARDVLELEDHRHLAPSRVGQLAR